MEKNLDRLPPLEDINAWLDYWYYELGRNPIPVVTRFKTAKKGYDWKDWQINSLPEDLFKKWKDENAYAEGIAIPAGKSWRGPHEGKFLVFIDLDNQKAIDEFRAAFDHNPTLEELAQRFVIEQHRDNPAKTHVFIFSDIAFVVKSSDVVKEDKNKPSFEVKGRGTHGVAFVTPSFHEGGYQYEIIGTASPITLGATEACQLMERLDEITKRYGLRRYLNDQNDPSNPDNRDVDNGKITVEELVQEGAKVPAGSNRHNALVKMGMSVYSRLGDIYPVKTVKRIIFEVLNDEYCGPPPLDRKEFEGNIWPSIEHYIPPNKQREDAANKYIQSLNSDKGIDPNKAKERSLLEVTRHNSGEWIIPKVKIVGVGPPYKPISKVTLKCDTCKTETIEDYSDMPLMSYKLSERSCSACGRSGAKGRDIGNLIAKLDHVEAQSITVQASEFQGGSRGGAGDDQKRLHVILIEDLTKNIRVGEIVTITGEMTVLNPYGSANKKPTSAMYARGIKYEREEESPITDDDIMLFQKFAKDNGVNTPDELVKMFAPQVIGHNAAKLGILRSIVSVREAEDVTGFRTRVHTDLAGDPGTVKSTLAYEGVQLAQNGEWIDSDHATIKSTLAIVDKDPETGGLMLMLGPIPRARNSVVGIDEISSTAFEDQQHYANVMEKGRFRKIAHGRDYDIDSPTTFIVTTNPIGGYWAKDKKPSLEQIPIKSNIRDRFDQHYISQDYETDQECREFAQQKAENYLNPESVKPDYDLLKRFLAYAASLPVPKLTPEATSMLSFFWQKMRKDGFMSNRSLDSLYRISLTQARLHLKSEVDVEVVKEVMKDMQIMYTKLGKLVDPAVEDPRTWAHEEIIQFVNTLSFPIEFTEALKYVYEHDELVRQYLGTNVEWWNSKNNKKIRAIHDMFTDGGTGELKQGSKGLAIAIHSMRPLTLVKPEVQKIDNENNNAKKQNGSEEPRSHRSDRSPNADKKPQEDSHDKKDSSTGDLNDLSDHDIEAPQTEIHAQSDNSNNSNRSQLPASSESSKHISPIALESDELVKQIAQKAMLDSQGNNKDYFTEDDWVFACQMWSNLDWTEDEAEQTLQSLVQEGVVLEEFEPGRYRRRIAAEAAEEGEGSN